MKTPFLLLQKKNYCTISKCCLPVYRLSQMVLLSFCLPQIDSPYSRQGSWVATVIFKWVVWWLWYVLNQCAPASSTPYKGRSIKWSSRSEFSECKGAQRTLDVRGMSLTRGRLESSHESKVSWRGRMLPDTIESFVRISELLVREWWIRDCCHYTP